jgi:transcriptional regulator with XRE-family HTH domain
LLGWSAQELADRAKIGVATVRRFESGNAVAPVSVSAMSAALSAAGIDFIASGEVSPAAGEGIRLKAPAPPMS